MHTFLRASFLALLLSATVFSISVESDTFAQEAVDTPSEVEDRDTAFQPSSGASTEQIPGGTLLIVAYIASFAALTLFMAARVRGKQSSIDARLEELATNLGIKKDSE